MDLELSNHGHPMFQDLEPINSELESVSSLSMDSCHSKNSYKHIKSINKDI